MAPEGNEPGARGADQRCYGHREPVWLSTPRGLASSKQRPPAGLGHNQEGQGLTGIQGSTYLEGLVYGREMANTLAYCSAAKFL